MALRIWRGVCSVLCAFFIVAVQYIVRIGCITVVYNHCIIQPYSLLPLLQTGNLHSSDVYWKESRNISAFNSLALCRYALNKTGMLWTLNTLFFTTS